jgi:Tol biopolymer transport system component
MRKISVILVCLLIIAAVFGATCTAFAGKPGGKPPKGEPPADPAIAYYVTGTVSSIVVMNADGSNRADVYHGPKFGIGLRNPSWSPDGSQIALKDGSALWQVDVAVVDGEPEGSNPTSLLDSIFGGPEWSPAGQGSSMEDMILFTRGSQTSLEVIPAGGGNTQTLYTDPDGYHIWYPVWSPTGDRIAFQVWDGDHYSLKILVIATGEVTTVKEPFLGLNLDWARTKDILAYHYYDEIYTLDISTKVTTKIVDGKYPSWSPDDSQLVLIGVGKKISGSIVKYDLTTQETTKLVGGGGMPDWCRATSS